MTITRRAAIQTMGSLALPLVAGTALAQGRRGKGPQQNNGQRGQGGRGQGGGPGGTGRGRGGGPQGGPGQRGQMDQDHQAIQLLLQNRQDIRRKVINLPNGVKTLTETDNAQLRPVLVGHVKSMYERLESGRPIHQRDPLFRELFQHAKEITMKARPTATGIEVIETSDNPRAVKLIQAHAQVVSLFLKNGHAEVRKNHAVP